MSTKWSASVLNCNTLDFYQLRYAADPPSGAVETQGRAGCSTALTLLSVVVLGAAVTTAKLEG